ncbi:hypothetical protein KGV55_01115 [Candidatus Gracilibacteria bacterium]|nr:hypothetical protein [Candidatus Gracilibacteria bacterium]
MKKNTFSLIIITSLLGLVGCNNEIKPKTLTSINPTTKQVVQNDSMDTIYTQANRIIYDNYGKIKKRADFIGIVQPLKPFATREHVNKYGEYNSLGLFYTKTEVKVFKVFKGDIKPGTIMEIIEPISIVKRNNGRISKISIDKYKELPMETPSLVFLSKNGNGQLSMSNAQNSYFPMQKTQTFARSGEVRADRIVQNRKGDKIHQAIYDGIMKDGLLNK